MASKPPAAEEILADYHAKTYENGISDANPSVKGQAVTIEDIATYNRLKQIVGETHAAKNTQNEQQTIDRIKHQNVAIKKA